MKLEIQSVKPREPFTSQYGTLYPFTLMGLLDGQLDSVSMNFKSPESAPKVGETLEVEVSEGKYGKTAKKAQVNAFRPGGRSPEEQDAIMRQNALDRAIQLFGVKSQFMKKEEVLAVTDEQLFTKALKYVEFYKSGKVPLPARTAQEVIQDEFADAPEYMTEEA